VSGRFDIPFGIAHQFFNVERLSNKIINAERYHIKQVVRGSQGNDDGSWRWRFEIPLQKLLSIHDGHQHIEENQMWFKGSGKLKTGLAVGSDCQLITLLGKRHPDQILDALIVLNYQYACSRSHNT